MIHAGGGASFGHSTAGSGAGGTDVQPLAPSVNISPQTFVLNLRIAHPSIGGPLGTRVSFVDFRDGRMTLRQNLAGLPLAFGHLIGPCRALTCQLLAVAPTLYGPGDASPQDCGCGIAPPAHQQAGYFRACRHHAAAFQPRGS